MPETAAPEQFTPMSVGQMLDRTFRLYRDHFLRFLAIAAVVYVPLRLFSLVVTSLIQFGMQAQIHADNHPGLGLVVSAMLVAIVGIFLWMMAQLLCTAALTRAVSDNYLGTEITVGQAYRRVLPLLGTLIWAGTLVSFVVFVGFLLLIIPGIIFSLWLSLTTPVIVVEGLGAGKAMGRSKSLVGGNLGRVFLVGLVVLIIGMAAHAAAGMAASLLTFGVPAQLALLRQVIGHIFEMAAEIAVAPVGAAVYILMYYDLRIRKEGFDLEMLADRMEKEDGSDDATFSAP